MKLYHFSNRYYEPDNLIPIGNFAKFIEKQSEVVKEFEHMMEEMRKTIGVSSPSRLNCLFTFKTGSTDLYSTNRKFLYELEVPEGETLYSHNYNIGTFFSNLFHFNNIDVLKEEEKLMADYWNGTGPYIDSIGRDIGYGEEVLVANPLKVKKIIIWNKLTVDDFINLNFPFYHITPTSNLESIFQNGLEERNGLGICVSQSKHPLIIKYITEMMLNNGEDINFSIIEILPQKHNLLKSEIKKDNVEEATNEIHNYIKRDNIKISPKDVINTYTANPYGISNVTKIVEELSSKGLLNSLF